MQSQNAQDTHVYVAKQPDANGYIHYSNEEDAVWDILYQRQTKLIENRACDAVFHGIKTLNLSAKHVPQCQEVSEVLKACTGWAVVPVPALISFEAFFNLLANRQFPAASFIRRREDLDYLKEPDIFHEIFGHCPLLTDSAFAAFTHEVGKFGLSLSAQDRRMLARLYWFTVEFGLINTRQGLRIYGAGIISSKAESVYALESPIPNRKPFNLIEVLRMPYRYDEMQRSYFVIDSFESLYNMINGDLLLKAFAEAKQLGLLPDPHAEALQDVRSC
jgi:phenylalanine-4-hydroxylase